MTDINEAVVVAGPQPPMTLRGVSATLGATTTASFKPCYASLPFTRLASYHPSPEGKHIWALVKALDTSAPDWDSHRLGVLARLSMKADAVHAAALKQHQLNTHNYRLEQARLYGAAVRLVKTSAPRDTDD